MKKLIRCKACGFVMQEGKHMTVCPACGVAATMFEPYTSPISSKRAQRLALHLHPVIVHAPQAMTFLILVFAVAGLFWETYRVMLFDTVKVLTVCLPVVVLAAIFSGIMDGVTRFRRVTAPIPVRKIMIGSLFFLLSVAMVWLVLGVTLDNISGFAAFLLCACGSFSASMVQGLLGTKLMDAKFPG